MVVCEEDPIDKYSFTMLLGGQGMCVVSRMNVAAGTAQNTDEQTNKTVWGTKRGYAYASNA